MDGSNERYVRPGAQLVAQRAREFADTKAALVPLPGHGETYARWSMLFSVARDCLALVKLIESHLDALAILFECDAAALVGENRLWAVWAANPPQQPLQARIEGRRARLSGVKPWCSGAHAATHALVVCHDGSRDWLAAVAMDARGVRVDPSTWSNGGMRAADTCEVHFDDVAATLVGSAGSYIERPGFWHGAIGVAACWLGGAVAVAEKLRGAATRRDDPHLFAHLGAVDASIRAARAALRDAARSIDERPREDAHALALATRATVERTVADVVERCGRALGAAPLCCDAEHAQRVADLCVFVRQSHAEHDLEALGRLCAAADGAKWTP